MSALLRFLIGLLRPIARAARGTVGRVATSRMPRPNVPPRFLPSVKLPMGAMRAPPNTYKSPIRLRPPQLNHPYHSIPAPVRFVGNLGFPKTQVKVKPGFMPFVTKPLHFRKYRGLLNSKKQYTYYEYPGMKFNAPAASARVFSRIKVPNVRRIANQLRSRGRMTRFVGKRHIHGTNLNPKIIPHGKFGPYYRVGFTGGRSNLASIYGRKNPNWSGPLAMDLRTARYIKRTGGIRLPKIAPTGTINYARIAQRKQGFSMYKPMIHIPMVDKTPLKPYVPRSGLQIPYRDRFGHFTQSYINRWKKAFANQRILEGTDANTRKLLGLKLTPEMSKLRFQQGGFGQSSLYRQVYRTRDRIYNLSAGPRIPNFKEKVIQTLDHFKGKITPYVNYLANRYHMSAAQRALAVKYIRNGLSGIGLLAGVAWPVYAIVNSEQEKKAGEILKRTPEITKALTNVVNQFDPKFKSKSKSGMVKKRIKAVRKKALNKIQRKSQYKKNNYYYNQAKRYKKYYEYFSY